jgi:pyruvate formate lyase activating enzyme
MNPRLLDEAAELSLKSGGCIKIDLKAWNESVHQALTGVSNKRTLENFKRLVSMIKKRPHPPPLIASTLLVPGYVDEEEVSNIARFIASLNPEIPYSLLGFYPHFYMADLGRTSRKYALRCKELAEMEGLKNVRIGNIHLLSNDYA